VGTRRGQHLVSDHSLNDAGSIPKIKKSDSAMVAAASYPTSQGHCDSGMLGAKSAGAVGAHHKLLPFRLLERQPILRVSGEAPLPLFLVFDLGAAETGKVRGLMLRLVIIAGSLLLGSCLALIDPSKAFACSCAGISTARAVREADAVFRGTVVGTKEVGRADAARTDIRFSVDRVYKGAVYREQVVASSRDSDACGLDPEVGSTWVIFAVEGIEGEGDQAVSRLVTTLCSGNLPTGIAPAMLGVPRPPLDGASDREEKSTNADRILTRGLGVAGISALSVVALVVVGLGVIWRPGRSG
jgi:hypothetical protein